LEHEEINPVNEHSLAETPIVGPASRRNALISDLRAFADWLEAHPELDPSNTPSEYLAMDYQPTRDSFLARLQEIGGPWEIDEDHNQSDYFGAIKKFGHMGYRVFTEKRQVGGKQLIERTEFVVYPDVLAEIVMSEGVSVGEC
jgi:hypothetical protein